VFLLCGPLRIGSLCGDAYSPQSALRYAEERREENLVAALLRCVSERARKGRFAKDNRINAAALCVFAPLREKPSRIKQFLCKACLLRRDRRSNAEKFPSRLSAPLLVKIEVVFQLHMDRYRPAAFRRRNEFDLTSC
jgi:hypothetical protein